MPTNADSRNPRLLHGLKARVTIAPIVFALLTLLMFADLLFSTQRVISHETTDLAMQFIPWRDFGFTQLRQGNLPLWNPHIYGGTPYFAGFQSALLYPPNWLHLLLPVGMAINWIVALHVFCAGYFTYLWCRGRSIEVGGSILAGLMFMFSGPYFLHIYAGHLPHLCVMVWIPLMLLALDKLVDSGDLRWCVLGVAATSLHILSGHPQYVYYTGIALTIYTALRAASGPHRLSLLGGFVITYVGAVLLTAVQLLPGIQAASEQVRSGGTDLKFASMFSLPVPNLITLLAPTFFGNVPLSQDISPDLDYWGACYLWEMSLFVSVAGLVLAVFAVVRAPRRSWIAATMLLVTLLLALGRHTPLYKPLFDLVPQYSSFRGTSKFTALTLPFICLLAAQGFDQLIRRRKVSWVFIASIASVGAALAALGIGVVRSSLWTDFLVWLRESSMAAMEWYWSVSPDDPAFRAASARSAAEACYTGAAMLLLSAALLWASRLHRLAPYALVVLASLEMLVFAHRPRATMRVADGYAVPARWREAIQSTAESNRIVTFDGGSANVGMAKGFENLAGYDPGVFKRFAELMFASQGIHPQFAGQYIPWRTVNTSVFRMYRCQWACIDANQPPTAIADPLPLALLVSDWIGLERRELILSHITRSNYDPATTVVLEHPPDVQTVASASAPGTVHASRRSTDEIEIEADLQRPAVLVITENFSTGWRVLPIESAQRSYRILHANWAQMAIPLERGKHHFTLEYSPKAFRIGRWVSIFALFGFAVTSFLLMRRRREFR